MAFSVNISIFSKILGLQQKNTFKIKGCLHIIILKENYSTINSITQKAKLGIS